jgi:hypothetical protein
MRTAIALHELLPESLYLECLSIETGRVGISAVSRTRRSLCSLCSQSRLLFASDGYDGYDTWAAGPDSSCTGSIVTSIPVGLAAGRRMTSSLSGLFRVRSDVRMAQDGREG